MRTSIDQNVADQRVARRFTDAEIAARVWGLLATITTIQRGAIKVDVVNRTVLLSGIVDQGYQSQAIQHAIEHLAGVAQVDNRLNIAQHPTAA